MTYPAVQHLSLAELLSQAMTGFQSKPQSDIGVSQAKSENLASSQALKQLNQLLGKGKANRQEASTIQHGFKGAGGNKSEPQKVSKQALFHHPYLCKGLENICS